MSSQGPYTPGTPVPWARIAGRIVAVLVGLAVVVSALILGAFVVAAIVAFVLVLAVVGFVARLLRGGASRPATSFHVWTSAGPQARPEGRASSEAPPGDVIEGEVLDARDVEKP